MLSVIVYFAYWAYSQPTEFDAFLGAQKDFVDDLYSGNLLADVAQEAKMNIDRTKGRVPDLESVKAGVGVASAPQTGCGFYNLGLLFIALRVQVSKSNFLSFVPHPSPPNEWSPRASGSLSQLIRVVPRACRGNIPSRVLSSCSERAPRGSLGRAATTGWPSGQTRCLLGRPPRARDDRQQSRSRDADADTPRQRSAPSRA